MINNISSKLLKLKKKMVMNDKKNDMLKNDVSIIKRILN
jgi:hypothetical protein